MGSTQSDRFRGLRPHVGLAVGVAAASTAAILIRLAQIEAHSLVVAAWRMLIAVVLLAPVALATRLPELRTLGRSEWTKAAASGLLLALHFAAWITSLAYTSVAASVALVWTAPIFVAIGEHILLRQRLSPQMIAALSVVTVGSVFIALGDWQQETHRVLGDLLALVGALSSAGYFLIGRQLRARLSLLGYVFPVYAAAGAALLALALVSGAITGMPVIPHQTTTWLWLFLLAVGPQILGHTSLNWALRYLSATFVTLATLGEAVGSTLLAWWLLGEMPSLWALAGGSLILIGAAIASAAERKSLAS